MSTGFASSDSGELHKTTLTTDWPIYLTTSPDKRLLARRRLPVPSAEADLRLLVPWARFPENTPP